MEVNGTQMLVGVASHKRKYGHEQEERVYARVSPVMQWIDEVAKPMRKAKKCSKTG